MATLRNTSSIGPGRLAGWLVLGAVWGLGAARGAETAPVDAAPAGIPFTQAKITEVVNDVEIVPAQSLTPQPAKDDEMFNAPDLLKTGRRSRAQLTADDGTVARVGSNSIFSFEPKSRTINLQQGSVLFNSPPGKGGGTVVTNSATATVLGTTIIVAATSDGGFKVLMLEGHGSVQLPNGQIVTLTAGQMVFVLPGVSQPGGKVGPLRVGPKVNFDLNRETEGSDLLHGFVMVLPSASKIKDAVHTQQLAIASGGLQQTDKAVVGAIGTNSIVVVDLNVVNTASNTNPGNPSNNPVPPTPPPNPSVVAALGTNLDFSAGPVPSGLLFLSPPIVFTAANLGIPKGLIEGNQWVITGIIAGGVTASEGGDVDLSVLDGLSEADIFAGNGMSFPSSTTFTGLNTTGSLVIDAESFSFGSPEGGPLVVEADFGGSGTYFAMQSISEADLNNVELTNPTGSMVLAAVLGDVNLDDSTMLAGDGDVFVQSIAGSVTVTDGSYLSATEGSVNVFGGRDITIADSTLAATPVPTLGPPINGSGTINIEAGGSATVTNTALLADNVVAEADNQLTVNNVNFSSTAQSINMSARTLVLYNVNFPGASVVNLSSLSGLLAARPNTGATVVPGDVNFVHNVNYNGQPAQQFIPVSQGGTGQFPTRINLGKM
jgi:hypothetical protein